MSDNYHSISNVWTQFPIEFERSTFNDDINYMKDKYENRAYLFDKYITKIIIIGNVSTGKSTLINAFLGEEYLRAEEGHGTKSFYYCSLSEKEDEYFTMNNSNVEIRPISALKNASRFSENRSDDINEKTVIRAYVKNDKSKILTGKTVIADFPGFRQEQKYEEEIEKHCSNADLFIFMFQIKEPATEKQIKYIKELRRKYNNPTCFFVYNKCDLPEFNSKTEMKTNLTNELYNLYGKDARNLRTNNDPLYFISAKEPKRFSDFDRLKADIIIYRDDNLVRLSNLQSIFSEEVNEFFRGLNKFVSNENETATSLSNSINELKNQCENNKSKILNNSKTCIDECRDNLQLEKIFNIIHRVINDHNEKCDKEKASNMIRVLEETFSQKVNEFVEKYLNNKCIDPINQLIIQINRNDTTGIKIDNDMEFQISTDLLIIPPYGNIDEIFWFFEFGDKKKKIIEYYTKFIKSNDVNETIRNSIINLYENEFLNIERNFETLLEGYNMDCNRKINSLKENLQKLDSNIEKLVAYEIGVRESLERFTSSSIN